MVRSISSIDQEHLLIYTESEMELKKLHMGTMSYGSDSMDEVAHQLALAFGLSAEQGTFPAFRLAHHAEAGFFQLLSAKAQLLPVYSSLQEVVAICLQESRMLLSALLSATM